MAAIERPASETDMLYQLWYAVIGSNGDGIASQVRDTRERVGKIEAQLPTLWSREDHERAEAEYAARDKAKATASRECKDRRRMSKREVVGLVIAGLGSLAGIGGVVVAILALA